MWDKLWWSGTWRIDVTVIKYNKLTRAYIGTIPLTRKSWGILALLLKTLFLSTQQQSQMGCSLRGGHTQGPRGSQPFWLCCTVAT